MELRRRQEGKVVSAVGDGGADQSYAVPQGGGGQVGAQEHWPAYHRQQVGDLTAEKNPARLTETHLPFAEVKCCETWRCELSIFLSFIYSSFAYLKMK